MTLKKEFFDYLAKFERTCPLRDFKTDTSKNVIGLRHDVDHSIDYALEMAFWEHDRGIRSTYYILPGTAYWNEDPRLLDKCLQIQDFGHEIGLHVNTVAEWFRHNKEPLSSLKMQLKRLREAGLVVDGIAAHGDPDCYNANFINYWVFRELRPDDPAKRETGLTAEGIPSGKVGRALTYPENHILLRPGDGEQLEFWQVSMKELGLAYHATHLDYDTYYTDSGGRWRVTPDPLNEDLRRGRIQINIHPIHWQTEPRMFFFLSTARSSSKWLTKVLDEASSLQARHEDFLNFSYENGERLEDHRTGLGYADWIADPANVTGRIDAARSWLADQKPADSAELNVYLERHVDILKRYFPHAYFVFLHRAPNLVVRSIMNREWFDTALDDRHPAPDDVMNWAKLTPFERCCHYVREAMSRLFINCQARVGSDELTSSMETCGAALKQLDIAFYPRLAEPFFETRINENKNTAFPDSSGWTPDQREQFDQICGPISHMLGYVGSSSNKHAKPDPVLAMKLKMAQMKQLLPRHNYRIPNALWFNNVRASPAGASASKGQISLSQQVERHAFIYLGMSGLRHHMSFSALPNAEYTVSFRGDVNGPKGALCQFFVVEDVGGQKDVKRRLLRRLEGGSEAVRLSFRPGYATRRFCFMFNVPMGTEDAVATIRDFSVEVPATRLSQLAMTSQARSTWLSGGIEFGLAHLGRKAVNATRRLAKKGIRVLAGR